MECRTILTYKVITEDTDDKNDKVKYIKKNYCTNKLQYKTHKVWRPLIQWVLFEPIDE